MKIELGQETGPQAEVHVQEPGSEVLFLRLRAKGVFMADLPLPADFAAQLARALNWAVQEARGAE